MKKKINFLGILNKYGLIFVLLLLCAFFYFMTPSFLSWQNIKNLLVQNTHVLVLSVGLTFVMMGGTLDMSVGYEISAVGVFTAKLLSIYGWSPISAALAGLALGAIFGAFNGTTAVVLKIDPMVVTLATTTIFQGISFLLSHGNAFSNYPAEFRLITKAKLFGVIPADVMIALVCVIVAGFIYKFTYYGRFVKAMGGNSEAARLAGINTKFMTISTFTICGFFTALAALIMISKQGTMNSGIGPGSETTGMTAAILGGISFNSGEGTMWGLVTGVFILAVIENGMQLAGWNQYIQYVVKGAILLIAIGYEIYNRNKKIKKGQA